MLLLGLVSFSFIVLSTANYTNLNVKHVETTENYGRVKKEDVKVVDNCKELMWFIQITDLHISVLSDVQRIQQFREFANITIGIIKPHVVIASGDLTDAKESNFFASRQHQQEWQTYADILQSQNIKNRTLWLDIRGNHDYFNVPNIHSKFNYFSSHSIQGTRHQGSYLEQIMVGSTKYSFIAVDASIEPGLKRPFNFIGLLNKNETRKLISLNKKASRNGGNYTIWFGHYPTSSIISPGTNNTPIRQIIGSNDKNYVYLAGHFHTFGGFGYHLYTMQDKFLELELGDWKKNRLFRVCAVDHGLFSFVDVRYNEWPIVLITNPKNALHNIPGKELFELKKSNQIHVLIFSPFNVSMCNIKIDDSNFAQCEKKSCNLYGLKWFPEMYNDGCHDITVFVNTSDGSSKTVKQQFCLDGRLVNYDIFSQIVLKRDFCNFFKLLFVVAISLCFFPILVCRILHKLQKSDKLIYLPVWCQKWTRTLCKLSSADRLFFPLISYCLYIVFGPWAIAELVDDHIGVVFLWGIYIDDAFLPGNLTYFYGFLQLMLCQLPLTILYAIVVDHRSKNINYTLSIKNNTCHFPFLVIITIEIILALKLWWEYGTQTFMLGSLRGLTVFFHLILWYLANNIKKTNLV